VLVQRFNGILQQRVDYKLASYTVKPNRTWLTTASLSLSLDAASFTWLTQLLHCFVNIHLTWRQEFFIRRFQSME